MNFQNRLKIIFSNILQFTVAGLFLCFALILIFRSFTYVTPVEATSIVYYPNFCLGGWKYPQHASGPSNISSNGDAQNTFNTSNSAFLESSVASQIFCGYFSVKDSKNPPIKATIKFNWLLDFKTDINKNYKIDTEIDTDKKDNKDSYTNIDNQNSPISPETGFVFSTTTIDTSKNENNSVKTTESVSGTTETIPENNINPIGTTTSVKADSEPIHSSDEVISGSPPAENIKPPEQSEILPEKPTNIEVIPEAPVLENSPQSFDSKYKKIISLVLPETAYAAGVDDGGFGFNQDLKDFIEINYSFDGIRWTSIGRVNRDNWKDFSVDIPVTSWEEVKRLQIMISILPTIDEKPDIYLDSISMRTEYKQTIAELASQGLTFVSNAADALIGDGNGAVNAVDIVPEKVVQKPPIEIVKKKLSFSSTGSSLSIPHGKTYDIITKPSADGSSFVVSGKCFKKYFVILTYRGKTDYIDKTSSFIANEAHECLNGNFSYDLSSLSTDLQNGQQYLLVGEQGEKDQWSPVSDLYPISIKTSFVSSKVNDND